MVVSNLCNNYTQPLNNNVYKAEYIYINLYHTCLTLKAPPVGMHEYNCCSRYIHMYGMHEHIIIGSGQELISKNCYATRRCYDTMIQDNMLNHRLSFTSSLYEVYLVILTNQLSSVMPGVRFSQPYNFLLMRKDTANITMQRSINEV